jgi:hypothetical protein
MRDDELLAHQGVSLRNATSTANSKREYTHTRTEDLDDGCPIGGLIPSYCRTCEYTDIIGYCCYPVDINTEISAGRARPLIHNHEWPERQACYEAIFYGDKKREREQREREREQRERPVFARHVTV